MLKYDLKNNKAVVDLPSIWEIRNNKIIITSASGKDYKDIPLEGYTIQVGNIEPIKIGATVSYGYNKNVIILENTTTSSKSDVTLCDPKDIVIQEYAGEDEWCKCTKGSNNKYLLYYRAMEENPSTEPRYAYFRHKTNVEGFLSEWYVTVMQKGKPEEGTSQNDPTNPYIPGNEPEVIIPGEDPEPVPTPEPTPTPDPEEPENPQPGGGGDTPVNPDPTPSTGDKSVRVRLLNPSNSGKTVNIYGVSFYITAHYNVTDCYVAGTNDTMHASLDTYKKNQNITLNPGESHVFVYNDITPWMNWLNADTVYWQNGLSLNGDNPVLIYTRAHWSEDYHTNILSGLIVYGQEYTFTIQ